MKRAILIRCSVIIIASLFAMGLSCGEKIPVKEMSLAKQEITRAQSVKADKYAPDELKAARDALLQSHSDIKADEMEKAKKDAELSFEKAREAYEKSIPLLAKDTIAIAEDSFAAADDAYAAELARNEYEAARKSLAMASEQFENKQYYESYQTALEADKQAKNARSTALGKKEILGDAIKEVEVTLSEAKEYKAEHFAPEKVKLAEDNLAIAQESYDEQMLKKGFAAVEVAKINADEAYFEALKGTAHKELQEAEADVATAKDSKGAKFAQDELKAADEALVGAGSLYEDARFKESISSANEASRLAGVVTAAKASKGMVSAKKEKTPETTTEGDYRIYTVKYRPGDRDCLWKIAEKFYGDGLKWKLIYNANKDKIRNPDLIKPGWKLKIPELPAKKEEKPEDKKDEKAVKEEAAKDEKSEVSTDVKMLDEEGEVVEGEMDAEKTPDEDAEGEQAEE